MLPGRNYKLRRQYLVHHKDIVSPGRPRRFRRLGTTESLPGAGRQTYRRRHIEEGESGRGRDTWILH